MSDPFPPEPVMGFDDLADDLRATIKSELAPDERLLWAARGWVNAPASNGSCLIAAAGLLAAGVLMAIIAGRVAGQHATDNSVQNFGAVLAVVGAIGLILSTWVWFLHRAVRRQKWPRTLYALTDRRAILWLPSGRRAVNVHTVRRGAITHIYRVEFPDGTGDVRWSPLLMSEMGPGGFSGIPDVRRVEELARRILLRYDTPSPD